MKPETVLIFLLYFAFLFWLYETNFLKYILIKHFSSPNTSQILPTQLCSFSLLKTNKQNNQQETHTEKHTHTQIPEINMDSHL